MAFSLSDPFGVKTKTTTTVNPPNHPNPYSNTLNMDPMIEERIRKMLANQATTGINTLSGGSGNGISIERVDSNVRQLAVSYQRMSEHFYQLEIKYNKLLEKLHNNNVIPRD